MAFGTEQRANISDIPFGETRHYVQRVLYYYEKYTKLYTEQWNG